MRITFVAIGWEQLGTSLLSAIAKQQGHQVNLAFSVSLFNDHFHLSIPPIARFFDDRQDVIDAIRKQEPDVLACSAVTTNYQWLLGIAKETKALFPNTKVVFGGVHPTAVPEIVLQQSEVDFVCVGEGDIAFPMILNAIEKGAYSEPIPNTRHKLPDGQVVRGPQIGFFQDLDSLPIYDKTLWEDYIPIGDNYYTMAARGCPYRCTFCFNNFFATLPKERPGKYIRRRSVDHMMFELRMAKKRYKLTRIIFFDDVFTLDKKWLREFLYEYRRDIGVPFECYSHAKFMDDEIGRLLADAGCTSVPIGVQSMDEQFKRRVIKRPEKTGDIANTIEILRKYKIKVQLDHMFGLPGESIDAQETARRFYIEHTPNSIQTYWTKCFPGTELVQQVLDLGLINAEEVGRINRGLDYDIYDKSDVTMDPEKAKIYQVYNLIFKLLPSLPMAIRKRLEPKRLKRFPAWLLSWVSFLSDIVLGLSRLSHKHVNYLRYILFHIYRFFCRKMGIRTHPASRPLTTEPYTFVVPRE
jgi:radical SAM superfamily enzyme YgiQ (UPF0313 family)